ncbi:hypothetical protein AVEN_258776-1 [Araneus ventricosus]|uniref:Uncharacterized protein n=1 Tax=Araneus ventricosus TaxID=182803 RepID=A0A4Y2D2J7_ARAVE|nr:hypothetical protein AVEN_258776-1 [Araneus ventricosus]
MPKNIWSTKKRKKNRKGKSSDSEQDAEIIERSRMLDPNEPSISIGLISDLPLNNPVKNEELIYPDTRFHRSTTLFPAKEVEEICLPSETPSETFKRSAEDQLISTMPKKRRENDPPETIKSTISDDCMIIENPKTRIKVEVIDLTDDSHPIVPLLCSPIKISYRENRLPDGKNTILQAIGDVHVKVESSKNRTKINADAVGSAGASYRTIQANAEQNKASESNSEVDTGKSYVYFNKNVDPPVDNLSRIQVKTKKGVPSESVNYDESSIKHSMGSRIQIKAEKGISSKNNTEFNLENSHIAVVKDADSTTRNIRLRSELHKENEDNRDINVPIKVEQNENCVVGDNSTSLSNFPSVANRTDIYPVDRPIKCEQNKTNENCEKMDFQNSYSYEKPQNNEDISRKITNSNNKNTGVVSSETSIRNELNRISISPITDWDIFSGDTLLYEPGTFRTPLLKYLNCTTKVEGLEISQALSALINLIKKKEEINVIESEVIPASIELQVKSKICLVEKGEELPDLQVNENQSLKVDEILHKISSSNFTELANLKPNITNLDSNSASSQLEKSINERQVQSPLNSDGLGDEMRRNNSPNMFFESHSKISESSRVSDSDSHTIYFNSPMDIENPLEDKCPSIICLSSFDKNERIENSNNLQIEEKKNHNEYFPNDLLRQILGNATSTEKSNDIADISSSLKASVDPIAKSNVIIDGSLFDNLHQIRLPRKKPVENVNFTTDVNERNSERTIKNSGNFSKSLSVPPENVIKRSHGVLFNPPTTYGDTFETPQKRVKTSEDDSISKSGSVNKLNYEEYKKDTRKMASPHYPPDHLLSNHIGPDFSSNSPDSSPGASNFGQNMFTPPANCQNSSVPVYSETSLQNPGYCHLVSTSSPQDSRLARNYSPALQRDVNSQKPLGSLDISQTCPSQSISEFTKLSVYPLVKQITPGSTTYAMPNFSRVIFSPTELFRPTINAMQIQQVKSMLPQMNSFQPPYLNQQTSMENSHIFPSPASESISFSMAQHNPQQSVQGVRDQQPFLSLLNFPGNASSPSSQYHHLVSQEISPPISRHNTLNYDNYSSESVNYGFGFNPPLPVGNPPPPPPLPPTPPPIVEQPHSIASNISPRSLLHNNKKLAATKNLTMPNQSPSKLFAPKPSLLPKHLREDIGKNIIHTNDVYLVIIERNIDWIHGIDKEIGIPRMTEIGGEFQQVRGSYRNHLMYYNTYFPLLLLECFSKISTALKASKQKEKKDRNICRVVQCETKQHYVSFTCDSFIRHSDVENIPKDGHIILVKFAAIPEGNVRMLGYVCSSATRAYSHRHDHGNEILKYVNVNKRTDLIKIRINFCIVFGISDINLDVPIHVSKLTSIKKALVLNDALKELRRSPLCDAILGLRNHNIKSFALPRRQDTNTMTTVVQEIVQSLNPSSSQLTVVKSAPFTDSFLAIVQIVEEIQKSKIPGKILVCVRSEMLCQMGMNLMETSSNVIIINRERESVHERLHSRVLDVKISHVSKAQNMPDDVAKSKVLQEAEVLLAVTGICFYEDVQSLARDLTYCIIHDAHSFTEPESLLPLLYGIRHLLLFGDPDESCIVNSKCGASLGYNKSLFHRAYNLC